MTDPNRERVWRWVCTVELRPSPRRLKLDNDMAALRHAEKYRGHTVLICRWEAGLPDVLVSAFKLDVPEDTQGECPF